MPPTLKQLGSILLLGCRVSVRHAFDACHILRTVHVRVLKFYVWISHGKIAHPCFFLSELSAFLELCPFEKIRMKSCQQDISKSVWARDLKLNQLIGDNELIT